MSVPPMSIPLSQHLLDANRDVWDAMQSHRFVRDIEADRLPAEVFARYLVFEHRFVETAVLIFGRAMLKAPGMAQRHRLIAVLHALSTEQLPAFSSFFAALGIEPAEKDEALPAAVQEFDRGMLRMAEEGGYCEVVAIVLAAEWMYATWCGRACAAPISSPGLRRWVALHTEPAFVGQVAWLRAEMDACAADEGSAARLSSLFRRALELEIAFHEAAYDASWPVRRRTSVGEAGRARA